MPLYLGRFKYSPEAVRGMIENPQGDAQEAMRRAASATLRPPS